MREPDAQGRPFGLMAQFETAESLVAGVRQARETGYSRLDAYSPFPLDELPEALGFHDGRVPWLTLAGGVLGAVAGYGMQVYTNQAYPLAIGGRPLIAPPAFALITFELMVLGAVLFSIGGMLVLNRLPRLHHPVFDIDSFARASTDRFFLIVFSDDEKFDEGKTRSFLLGLQPVEVALVAPAEPA